MNILYRELPDGVADLVSPEVLDILAGYADDMDAHNADLTGHSRRVAEQSVLLARSLGYEGRRLAELWLYARFHDIGKLYVDRDILGSKGLLSPQDRLKVEMHADYGVAILKTISDFPQDMLDVTRFHHERFDGHGYHKLAGEDIPELARIVQVADVFDAMVSKRTYKDGQPMDAALKAMTTDVPEGKFGRPGFDPEMLRAFVGVQLGLHAAVMDPDIVAELQVFSDQVDRRIAPAASPSSRPI